MPEGSGRFGLLLAAASPAGQRLSPPRRRLGIAASVSLLLHGVVIAALLVGLAQRPRIVGAADTPAIVELVMSPPGSHDSPAPNTAPAPDVRARPVARPAPEAPKPEARTSPKQPAQSAPAAQPVESLKPAVVSLPEPMANPMPQTQLAVPEPLPPPPLPELAPAPQPKQASAAPAPAPTPPPAPQPEPAPASKPALQFSLGGIASDTNALVTGAMLLPPTADPRYRNRKPDYPLEAVHRGERGAVVLLIHVTPGGHVAGVDITETSGYVLLDRAAREAALSWRFLPALRDGEPVPFEMPLRVVFDLN